MTNSTLMNCRMIKLILISWLAISAPMSVVGQDAATSETVADSISGKHLGEVVVKGETIRRNANKDIITITDNMRDRTKNVGELIGKIPGIFSIL